MISPFDKSPWRALSSKFRGAFQRLQQNRRVGDAVKPAAAIALGIAGIVGAAPAATGPLVLTNINQIWDVAGEAAQHPQRIQTDAVIYYFDAEWSVVFGECRGRATFIPISDCPTPLKPGQHIAIDGMVVPSRQHFLWDQTKIHVLAENALPRAVDVSDLSLQASNLNLRLISIPALIEHIESPSPHHIRMNVLS